MHRHYYGAKVLLVVLGLVIAGMSATVGPSGYRSSMAHLQYGAAVQVEATMLRTSAKIAHGALQLISYLRGL
jgi:hypothetical protein